MQKGNQLQSHPIGEPLNHGKVRPSKKPSKLWRYFFIVIAIPQVLALAVVAYDWTVALQPGMGEEGFAVVAWILYWAPVVAAIAFVNFIVLLVYVFKHKPRGKSLVFSIVPLVVLAVLTALCAYSFYQLRVGIESMQHVADSPEIQNAGNAYERKFARDNAQPEITKDEAISLLKSCQLKGFYYGNQTNKNKQEGLWGELSSTGVVLTRIDGDPYRISVADRLVPELLPIAREAQKTCSELQISD